MPFRSLRLPRVDLAGSSPLVTGTKPASRCFAQHRFLMREKLMDQKTVRKLERELEVAIVEVVFVRDKNYTRAD